MAVRRVKRSRAGDFVLRIPPPERDVLGKLPEMLRGLLEQDDRTDPALRRLFPSAYPDDEEAAVEFESVVRDDLVAQRTAAIETMERTLQASRLTEDELLAWLAAMNDLRLVLGVRLAVTEESTVEDFEGDPETQAAYGLYAYLSYLEEDVVLALSS
ncbi:MAG: DUF2017 family protein, partial [Actinomycetota bacterium]